VLGRWSRVHPRKRPTLGGLPSRHQHQAGDGTCGGAGVRAFRAPRGQPDSGVRQHAAGQRGDAVQAQSATAGGGADRRSSSAGFGGGGFGGGGASATIRSNAARAPSSRPAAQCHVTIPNRWDHGGCRQDGVLVRVVHPGVVRCQGHCPVCSGGRRREAVQSLRAGELVAAGWLHHPRVPVVSQPDRPASEQPLGVVGA
jgi:hypothetical protein